MACYCRNPSNNKNDVGCAFLAPDSRTCKTTGYCDLKEGPKQLKLRLQKTRCGSKYFCEDQDKQRLCTRVPGEEVCIFKGKSHKLLKSLIVNVDHLPR